MSDQRAKWNKRYRENDSAGVDREPAFVLTQHAHLLPSSGVALDLACGMGANALFLARQGLQVCAWDISDVAIDSLRQDALQQHLEVSVEVRDVVLDPPIPDSFDVIVVSHFLDRSIISSLVDALKPGGVIFYQTFIREKSADVGPACPDFLLETNELLQMFAGLNVLAYREEGMVGNVREGFRNEAMLVAQNP